VVEGTGGGHRVPPVFAARGRRGDVVRRTHRCRRCDAAIDPGDVYGVVDVLDGEGRIRTLLCASCAAGLRSFVEGEGVERDGDGDSEPRDDSDGDGDGDSEPRDDSDSDGDGDGETTEAPARGRSRVDG
jgi:hypothetical protein